MTMWFNRKPGDVASQGSEDETALLIGDSPPDWVRLPPDLGGTQLKVLGVCHAECPKCHAPNVRHLDLEQGYGVAECTGDGFVWYRRRS